MILGSIIEIIFEIYRLLKNMTHKNSVYKRLFLWIEKMKIFLE